ncbi:MAG TPA: Crp/Fnr family transcriptional regulator [Ktedonobacterales bacterium]|jgi:CRP/FNR family transcriptional regulator|nr:Crp/Fnr family transcriptional regulator [Ktedonobacterales bacterium]
MAVELEALRAVPMFAALGPDDLRHVAGMAVERNYDRGDIILLEGSRASALHYVRAGLVKIFKTSPDGKEQVLRLIAPGHTFNDVPALDGGPNPASAAAVEPSVVYAIGSTQLRQLILERPAVAAAAVRTLADALRHMVALVEVLSFRHVAARVAKIVLDQAESEPSARHAHRLTQQEMAAMAGTAREMVGRALKELEAAGAIEMRRGQVVVLNLDRLRMLAHAL